MIDLNQTKHSMLVYEIMVNVVVYLASPLLVQKGHHNWNHLVYITDNIHRIPVILRLMIILG